MTGHGSPPLVHGPSRLRRPARPAVRLGTALTAVAGAALLLTGWWWPGLAVLAVASSVVVIMVAMLIARPRVRIGSGHRSAWRDAERHGRTITRCWPAVRRMTGVRDAAPVIAAARWDLALLIAQHDAAAGAGNQAKFAGYGLAPDDPLRDELARRQDQLAERLPALDAEIARRVERLRTLAERCAHAAHDQDVLRRAPGKARRARAALRRADEVIVDGSGWAVRPDPATDLAERAGAVLAAYRELAG